MLEDELNFGCFPALSRVKAPLPHVSLALSCSPAWSETTESWSTAQGGYPDKGGQRWSTALKWHGLNPLPQGFKFQGAGSCPLPTPWPGGIHPTAHPQPWIRDVFVPVSFYSFLFKAFSSL